MPELNIALAKKVLEFIEAHPERHNQSTFIDKDMCGTTLCVAGHAMVLSGEFFATTDTYNNFILVSRDDELEHDYSDAGQRLLGLNDAETDHLFFQTDNTEAVDCLAELVDVAEKGQKK